MLGSPMSPWSSGSIQQTACEQQKKKNQDFAKSFGEQEMENKVKTITWQNHYTFTLIYQKIQLCHEKCHLQSSEYLVIIIKLPCKCKLLTCQWLAL